MSNYVYTFKRRFDKIMNEYYDHDLDCFPLLEKLEETFSDIFVKYTKTDKYYNIEFSKRLSNDEERLLDNLMATLEKNYNQCMLNKYKEIKIEEIRSNVDKISQYGFEWPSGSGYRFNVTTFISGVWHRMKDAVEEGILPTFPVIVRDINNIPHQLNSMEEVKSFYKTGVYFRAYLFATSTELIKQVRSFTKLEDVINFEDPRLNI